MKFWALFVAVVLFAVSARLYRLSTPQSYYFDEVYHAFTAQTYLHNDPKGYEFWQTPPQGVAYEWTHPPLAKLLMAGGMYIFGENSFGWRISSVVFGTGVIILAGCIAEKLFRDKITTLLVMFFLSTDGLLLSMSRIAMNDMHFLFFALAAIYSYIHIRYSVTNAKKSVRQRDLLLFSLWIGLALASKWTALYVGLALAIDFSLLFFSSFSKMVLKKSIPFVLTACIIVPLVYMSSYTQFFFQGHTLSQWRDTTNQMWWYHTGLKATHTYQSRPLQWISDMRPVWMYVEYGKNMTNVSHIYNSGNPLFFWFGALSALVLVAVLLFSWKMKWEVRFILLLYFSLWLPWLFSPRIMFFYHYAPALPFLALLLSYSIRELLRKQRALWPLAVLFLLATLCTFLFLYPLNTGYPMPARYFDFVFTQFPTWK